MESDNFAAQSGVILMIQSYRETLLFFISTPMYVIAIIAEVLASNWAHDGRYTLKGAIQNFYIMAINLVIDVLMRLVALFVLTWCFKHAFLTIENKIAYWVVLFLLQDLAFYTMHYVDHRVRLFWAVHVTHHNSEEYNLGVGFRSSVFEPVYRFMYFIPLTLIGLQPLDIFFVFSICQLYGIFIHTQYVKKLGFIEYILATPSHHRVHHGQNPIYIDKNMGMFLIFWDKLFGTFQEETEPVKFGVTKPPKSNRPDEVILHEFRNLIADVKSASSIRAKLMYIFGPPGWRHDEKTA
jgi:sterol desaturase/sphingolipid hydroxylase (fatty acid hydroxylase superfamily)